MANSPITTVSNNPTGSIFNLAFLQGAAERSIKTGAQFVVGILLLSIVDLGNGQSSLNALELDWELLLGTFLGGALLSLATSVANPQFVGGTQALLKAPEPVGGLSTPATAGMTSPQLPAEPATSEVTPTAPAGGSHTA